MKSTLLAVTLALLAANAAAQSIDTPESVPEAAPASTARRTPAGTMAKGSRGAALVNANEAERRLVQAQQKRSRGMAPLPGESVKVPGGMLVNTRYWNRQEKLRIEVEMAQRRSNETQRPQLARK